MTGIASFAQPALSADLAALVERYAGLDSSDATARAYTADWEHFQGWCAAQGAPSLPCHPATAGAYLAAHAGALKVATLERRLAAIGAAHRQAGHGFDRRHPAVQAVLSGIKRAHGRRQRRVEAATTDVVKLMVAACEGTLAGLRDKAMLLLGFAGAFRRSELAALLVSDLRFEREGLRVAVRRSKTDQVGRGQEVGIASPAAVEAVRDWLAAAGITEGALFRSIDRHGRVGASLSDKAVANVVKARAEMAGLDPAEFSGHSLRAGFATEAARQGIEERIIQHTTRHADVTVLRRYIRGGTIWTENASGKLGL